MISSSDNDKLTQLISERDAYMLNGNYDKAKECDNQIESLQSKIELKKAKELKQQHKYEVNVLDKEIQETITKIANEWECKFKDLEQRKINAERELKVKHKNEMDELLKNAVNKGEQHKVKHSKDYLMLAEEEKILVKFHKFDLARVVRKQKEEQKMQDEARSIRNKERIVKANKMKLIKKQKMEMEAVKMKFQSEYDILVRDKEKEVDVLQKKFYNKKQEMDMQHKNEVMFSKRKELEKALMRKRSACCCTGKRKNI